VNQPLSVPRRDVIRWGIIGCGDVTEVKSGPALQLAQGSQLMAVMRRNGALAADYAKRHGVPRWYDDARSLVNDPEVDAVYVATPPGAHLEGAKLAAAAGKPAYVEKPMARHAPECAAMLTAFAGARQKLFVAYYRRALPRFLKVRELLVQGAIGPLTSVTYRMATAGHLTTSQAQLPWRLKADDAGGGLLLDVGSHTLDLLDFFCGPLTGIHGCAANLVTPGEVEDAVAMTFRTATGIPGAATWNFASFVPEDSLEFTGTTGRITFSVFGNEPVTLKTAAGVESFDLPNPKHIQQPMIQTVVDDLLGRGHCESTGESAQRTNVVMDQILSDYYGGRQDAFWARPDTWPRSNVNPRHPR